MGLQDNNVTDLDLAFSPFTSDVQRYESLTYDKVENLDNDQKQGSRFSSDFPKQAIPEAQASRIWWTLFSL
jgi:hypothetical protein